MSTHIENEVVSMQFDNKHFESNVRTSLSTLDKLKQSLKLHDAAKGFEGISASAKRVNLSPLSGAVEQVGLKFSGLYTIADQTLRNIVNTVERHAKQIVSAFTIDPVKTGFSEYELKMGSIQTIMASTGEDLAVVNKYLDELNTYSDKTIYSFSDMTTNIGKFTNAGVKLEDAVAAIQGISNVAAVSGANANEASRAMYNFAQALSSGYVKLIDWKSIELANMGTVEFKNQLLEAAVAAGTLTRTADGMYATLDGTVVSATKNFNESLQEQWLTTEVLVGTLKDYADETTEIGKKAFAAAQDVKTFSQMMDTLKETAQSGWASTWQLIIGDFEEAKTLWTNLNNIFSEIINSSAERRNNLLSGALDNAGWDKVVKIIRDAKIEVSDFEAEVKKLAKENGIDIEGLIKEYGSLEAVIKKLKIPVDILKKAFDNLFKGPKGKGGFETYTVKAGDTLSDLAKKWGTSVDEIMFLNKQINDPDLILEGWTLKIPKAIEKTGEAAADSTDYIKEFNEALNGIEGESGRDLLIESFANLGTVIKKIADPIKEAFRSVFKPLTSEQIYGGIVKFNKFTEGLANSKRWSGIRENLFDTFKGAFSLVDILGTLIGGGLKLGWKAFTGILEAFGPSILEFTADVGKAITKVNDWLNANIDTGITWFINTLKWLYNLPEVQNVIKSFSDSWAKFKTVISERWGKTTDAFWEWVDRLKELDNVTLDDVKNAIIDFKDNVLTAFFKTEDGGTIFDGLIESAKKFGSTIATKSGEIWNNIKTWWDGLSLLDGFSFENIKKAFSDFYNTVVKPLFTKADGTTIFDGLATALSNFWTSISSWFSDRGVDLIAIKDQIVGFASGISDWFGQNKGVIIAVAGFIGIVWSLAKVFDVVKTISKSINFLGDVGEGINNFCTGLGKSLKYTAASSMIKSIAMAIAVLAGSVAALSLIPTEKLWSAVGAIAAVSGILMVVYTVSALVSNKIGTADLMKFAVSMLAVSGSLMIFALAAKAIGAVDEGSLKKTAAVLAGFLGVMTVLAIISKIGGSASSDIFKSGSVFIGLGIFLLLLSSVVNRLGNMDPNAMRQGLIGITVLLVESMGIMIVAGKLARVGRRESFVKVGGLFAGLGVALLMMSAAIAIMGNMKTETLVKGMAAVTVAILLMMGMMVATNKLAKVGRGSTIVNAAGMFMGMGVALLALAGAVAIFGNMDTGTLVKGGLAVLAFMGIMVLVMKSTKFLATTRSDQQFAKVGGTILAMSAALILMAGAVALLSLIDGKSLAKAVVAVGALSGMLMGLIAVTQNIPAKSTGSLVVLTTAIVLLAGAVAALTLIDPKSLVTATASLGGLIGMLALFTYSTKSLRPNRLTSLIAIGALVAGLAFIIYKMKDIPAKQALSVAGALSALMLSLSATLFIASKATRNGNISLKGIGMISLALLAVGAIATLFAGIAIGSLPTIGTKLSEFMTNLNPFISGVERLAAVSNVDKNVVSEIADLFAAMGELAAGAALFAVADKFTGGKATDSFEAFTGWINEVLPIIKDFGVGLTGVDINKENLETVIGAVRDLATAANLAPKQQMGGFVSKLGGGVYVSVPALTEFKNWIVQVAPVVKDFAIGVSAKDVKVDKTKIDAVCGAATTLATAAASAPSVTIAGGGFASKWVSGGGGVVSWPMLTAAKDWIVKVAPAIQALAESLGSGEAKNVNGDNLKAICEGAKILAEGAALAPSVDLAVGFAKGPWGIGGALGFSHPMITAAANWIANVKDPIIALAKETATGLDGHSFNKENFLAVVGSLKTISEAMNEAPTFDISAGGGFGKLLGGWAIMAAANVSAPLFDYVAGFIENVRQPIINLANATVTGITGKFNKENFESVVQAVVDIAGAKFPTISGGLGFGGVKGIGGIIAGGVNWPDVNAAADFITNVKEPIVGLINATKTATNGEFNKENFNTVVKAIVDIGSIDMPSIDGGVGFGAITGIAAFGGLGVSWPQVTATADFITNVKQPIIDLINATSTSLPATFNKENFSAVVQAIVDIGSMQFPQISETWGGAATIIGIGLGESVTSADFNGLVNFITKVKNPIILLAKATANKLPTGFNKENFEAIVKAIVDIGSIQYPSIESFNADFPTIFGKIKFTSEQKKDFDGFVGFIQQVKDPIIQLGAAVSGKEVSIDSAKLTSVVDAVKILADAALNIPITGGFVNWWTGETEWEGFMDFLSGLSEPLTTLTTNISGSNIDPAKISVVSNAVKNLAEAANAIPDTAGWWEFWTNTTDWDAFMTNVPKLGLAISDFSKNCGEMDLESVAVAALAVNRIGTAIGELNYAANTGIEEIVARFTTASGSLAEGIVTFSGTVAGINVEAVNSASGIISSSVTALKTLTEFDVGTVDTAAFKTKLTELADAVSTFASGDLTTDPSTAITNAKSLLSLLKDVSTSELSTTSFTDALTNLASTSVEDFVGVFKSAESIKSATDAGSGLGKAVSEGIVSKISDVSDAGDILSDSGSTSISSITNYVAYSLAGAYVGSGFVAGIGSKVADATNAGTALGKAALAAAKAALDEHSPSREFFKVGEFAGMGLVNALYSYESKTYDAGYDMAESAKDGLGRAISKVRGLIENGIDAQPTIRPVLDLTDVSAGASRINSLFGTPSVGVLSKVGTISTMMNGIQNGSNNDVISAINDLGRRMGNTPGNTYNINGITYDDGSNITKAIETLVNAAIKERRS